MRFFSDVRLTYARAVRAVLREPSWIIIGLAQPLFYLYLFGPLLKNGGVTRGLPAGTSSWDVFVPGLLVQVALALHHLRQPLQDLRTGRFRVVLVILLELRGDVVALGQTPRDAGVLAGDDIDPGEGLQRPQRDVTEIADGGRDQVQARRGLRRDKAMGVDGETARGGLRRLRCVCRGRLCAHNQTNLGMIRGAGNRSTEKDRAWAMGGAWGKARGKEGLECDPLDITFPME